MTTVHVNSWFWGRKDTIILDNGIAFCHLEFPEDEKLAFISDVCVLPGYRRKGLGNRLLDICIKRAKANRLDTVQLCVDNDWAQKWYERRGFELIGFNGDGLPLMELKIQ